MEILITGGCGYIGSHAVVEFINDGHKVTVIDNFCNCSRSVQKRIQKITKRYFKVYECDLRDIYVLDNIFSCEKFDAVIHFAGLKSISESYDDPLGYYDNNILGTLNLLKIMKKYRVKNFIFSSSASVYGFNLNPPFKESMQVTIPVHPYGKTKFMIEQISFDIKDINSCILRYFNPVGAHQSGIIGENPKGVPNNLMPIIVSASSGRIKELTVFGNDYDTPDGTCIRDYIHVVDLAKGHLKALDYLVFNEGCHVFNLGTGKGTSVLELIKTFEKVNNLKVRYKIGKRREGDLPVCFASCEKANKILGWKADLGLSDMCSSSWNWEVNMKNFEG